MKRFKFIFAFILAALALGANAETSGLYAVGGFNNWDIANPAVFNYENGVYTLAIDFTSSDIFKISTVNTTGKENGWDDFDTGSLNTIAPVRLNTPVELVAGTGNITSPARKPLTVIVDLEKGTITLSDGGEPSTDYSGSLPVLYINTVDNAPIEGKEKYVIGSYWLDPVGLTDVEAIGSKDAPLPLQIKGRGNYTWIGFDKKPYRLKLDAKASFMGMKKSKHYALMAAADDRMGFLRNPVGYKASELLGLKWASDQRPVEVVLNGDYKGLYFLTENIRVDKDRVNIVEQPDLITNPDSITGGWLVEIDNYDADPHVTVTEHNFDYPIWFTYKTPEELSQAQEMYLFNEMSRINDLIYGDKNSPELWKHLDLDAAARFYLVQELTDNHESYHGSCYLHKEMGNDTKWTFGPVWDFGSAIWEKKQSSIADDANFHQVWIKELTKFPAFQEKVKEVWNEFAGEKLTSLYTYINDFATSISTACKYDAVRWPQYANADEMSKASQVKSLIGSYAAWLIDRYGNGNLTKYSISLTDHTLTPWENAYAYIFDPSAIGYTGTGNYQPLGPWPGTIMTKTQNGGTTRFELSFTSEYTLSDDARIIFNNNDGQQSGDLFFTNGENYNRNGGEFTGIGTITATPGNTPATYYNLQGHPVNHPLPGNIYIVRRGNTVTKILMK